MLIKGDVSSVFVNQAVSRFPDSNKRHIMLGIQETSGKRKTVGELIGNFFP